MSTYSDRLGRPSRPGIHHTGETKQNFVHKERRYFCNVHHCNTGVSLGSKYCAKHSNACSVCGERINPKSTMCRLHSNQNPTEKMVESRISKSQNTKWRANMNRADQLRMIIRCYEDAWLAGRWPRLCELALPKLREDLINIERLERELAI